MIAEALRFHDDYYRMLETMLRDVEAQFGRFVVLDVHSYNHRRNGPDAPPAPPETMPEINIGTFSMDRRRWSYVLDPLIERMGEIDVGGRRLTVRENVAFQGKGEQTRFIHGKFPETGCAIAIEFKKSFMDEWTGLPDRTALVGVARRDPLGGSIARGHSGGGGMTAPSEAATLSDAVELAEIVVACLTRGEAVRQDLPGGGRVHIDRPLPFLCVHASDGVAESAALDVATAHASYLIAPELAAARRMIDAIGRAMLRRYGAFMVVEVGELERDRLLADDSPYLPPFEIMLLHGGRRATTAAADAFTRAVEAVEVKYRSPQVEAHILSSPEDDWFGSLDRDFAWLRVDFAAIYRQPESERVYPDLRQRLVAGIFDAILQAIAAFLAESGRFEVPSHRALGRRLFVEAVRRLDARIDEVAVSFDFLLAVTPINADIAWHEFRASGFQRAPRLLYRPLALEIDAEKCRLHAMSFANLEDPLLTVLYREKQQELDMQLTLLGLRDSPRFREASRVLYGPVGPELLRVAEEILLQSSGRGDLVGEGSPEGSVDSAELRAMACAMVEGYRAEGAAFDAHVEVRNDIPAGMMVSGPRLLIGRTTVMARRRVEALLSHEIGVHLFTYFSGDLQGLRVFRSGLAGYEAVQEGLAVFAEYLVGGLTLGRLRLWLRARSAAPRCSPARISLRPSGCYTETEACPPPPPSASRYASIAPVASPRMQSTSVGCSRYSITCVERARSTRSGSASSRPSTCR